MSRSFACTPAGSEPGSCAGRKAINAMLMQTLNDEDLRRACFTAPVIDTHEHLASPPELYRQPPDFLTTLQKDYLDRDLLSAGLGMQQDGGAAVFDTRRPLAERIDA